jgi:hypothetical protein
MLSHGHAPRKRVVHNHALSPASWSSHRSFSSNGLPQQEILPAMFGRIDTNRKQSPLIALLFRFLDFIREKQDFFCQQCAMLKGT